MFSALPSLTSLDGFDRDGKEVNPPGEEDDEEDDEEESEDDGPGLEYLQKELLVGYHGDHCHVLGDSVVVFLLVCGQYYSKTSSHFVATRRQPVLRVFLTYCSSKCLTITNK